MKRRWVYTEGGRPCEPYEVEVDAPLPPRVEIATGNFYEGARATDGTPIDTRKRHREYMKREGVAMADDFKETRARAAEARARYLSGEPEKATREAVQRAWYEVHKP